jgi:acetamidase/formamidase
LGFWGLGAWTAGALASGVPGSAAHAQNQARTHDLRLTPAHVQQWGFYDATVTPVLRISSGDTLRVETMVAGGLGRLRAAGATDAEPESLKAVEAAVTERGPGVHPLTGPVWVEGAEPGDVLEVRIQNFEFLHPYGVTGFIPGSGTLPNEFPYSRFKLIRFDLDRGVANFAPGIALPLRPFFGSIGVAPNPLVRRVSSGPPGHHTGNLDNKELVAGSTLFVPVHAPGALLSFGDAHAMQGDGEVTLTALETSVRGSVQVLLRKGMRLNWPRAETPTHYIVMGLHPDLDEASQIAVREAVDFLAAEKGLSRDEAYILTSIGVDLRVTQLVDGTKGVHAMIPKSMFSK